MRITTGRAWCNQLRSTCSSTSARVRLAQRGGVTANADSDNFRIYRPCCSGLGRAKSTCTSCSGLAGSERRCGACYYEARDPVLAGVVEREYVI